MKVYLSGQVLDWNNAIEWRETVTHIANEYGVECVNPIKMHDEQGGGFRELIFARNNSWLRGCDLLLVRWDEKANSVGTVWEIAYARENNIPVIIMASSPKLAAKLDEDPYIPHLHCMESVLHFSESNLRDVFEWWYPDHVNLSSNDGDYRGGYGADYKPSFIA